MDHVAGPLHILMVGKEGRIWFNIICFKLYQFESNNWWPFSILKYVMEFALQSNLKCVLLENIKKKVLIHSPPCRTPCKLFIHKVFFGPLGLHLHVWSELGRSPPFQPMRALRVQWSRAFKPGFKLVCEVALIVNRGILLQTLNVNPTLFVIPCVEKLGRGEGGIVGLQCCNWCQLPSEFSPEFQSSMTQFHCEFADKRR
jgi:hypothetical protein